jgi:hypothetical protein
VVMRRLLRGTARSHWLYFAKAWFPALKGFLSTWRRLLGLGLQANLRLQIVISPMIPQGSSVLLRFCDAQSVRSWLRDFPKTLERCRIQSTLARLPMKSSGVYVLGCCAFRRSDRFTSTVSIRQRQVSSAFVPPLLRRILPRGSTGPSHAGAVLLFVAKLPTVRGYRPESSC